MALGDGGAYCTNDELSAVKVRAFREHGQIKKYEHRYIGSTSRLDNIQAVFLSKKLPHLRDWNNQRIEVARKYSERLKSSEVEVLSKRFDGGHVYHLMIVETDSPQHLEKQLLEQGVGHGSHYPYPIHQMECFKKYNWSELSFPNAERLASNTVSLPIFPGMTDSELEHVVNAINSFRISEAALNERDNSCWWVRLTLVSLD